MCIYKCMLIFKFNYSAKIKSDNKLGTRHLLNLFKIYGWCICINYFSDTYGRKC